MKVKRIQRKRTRGWKMPGATIYVGRPTKFGNPFNLDDYNGDRTACVHRYEMWINASHNEFLRAAARRELQGFNLACWCKEGERCHADILLKIAN